MTVNGKAPHSPDEADGLGLPRRRWAVLAILLGISLFGIHGAVVYLALPGLTEEFGLDAARAVWIIIPYQLVILALLLPIAALGERFGFRRTFLCGVAVFVAGSAACALATSLPALAVARALQGAGAAAMMATNPALIRLTYPHALLGRGIALNSLVVALSTATGPTLGALVLTLGSWHLLFALNVPLGILVLAAGWKALPDNNALAPTPIRMADVALNILTFGLLVGGANVLTSSGKLTAASLLLATALLTTGAAVAVFYLRRQAGQRLPLFPIDLLRNRQFALSASTSVSGFCAQVLALVCLPFLMLTGLGWTTAETGTLLTAWPLATLMVAPVVGRLIGRYQNGLLAGMGLALMSAGLGCMAAAGPSAGALGLAWRLGLCGIGFGLFQAPNNHALFTSAPLARAGAAGGMLGVARSVGQTAGAVVAAAAFSLSGAGQVFTGAVFGLAIAAAVAAVGAAVSMLRCR